VSAWDDVQTEPVDEIEATVFRQMEGRSNSDARTPWADLVLALCQRIRAAESALASERRRVATLEGRLARVLRYAHGYFGHMGTGVWSRRLTPPRRTGGGK
jgi:hypothetical protein